MNYVVILAGGTGSRAGGPLPKQFQMLGELRMLWWSVKAFLEFDHNSKIILVVHPDFLKDWGKTYAGEEKKFDAEIIKVPGGKSRIQSVKNALDYIATQGTPEELSSMNVFIHDSARPFVTPVLIGNGVRYVGEGIGSVPVIPLVDSIRRIYNDGSVAVDRSEYAAVQTPQIFKFEDIYSAYLALKDENGLTDDASVAEHSGIKIITFPGDDANIKITTPSDLRRWT